MTVFLAYYPAGLGLLVSLRALLSFPLITAILRWFLVFLLFALGLLIIRNGMLAAKGRANRLGAKTIRMLSYSYVAIVASLEQSRRLLFPSLNGKHARSARSGAADA